MGSKGIADKVAIVAMGCTRFGELWDQSQEDMIITAVDEALGQARLERSPDWSCRGRWAPTTSRSPAWRTTAPPDRNPSATPATPSPAAPTTG